jgi:hypothetical protein
MANLHHVVDSRGQTHKRRSVGRIYTHAVIVHLKAIPATERFRERPADDWVSWAGSEKLAQKAARGWNGHSRLDGPVEIIPAIVRTTVPRRTAAADKKIADHVDGYDRDDIGESPDF